MEKVKRLTPNQEAPNPKTACLTCIIEFFHGDREEANVASRIIVRNGKEELACEEHVDVVPKEEGEEKYMIIGIPWGVADEYEPGDVIEGLTNGEAYLPPVILLNREEAWDDEDAAYWRAEVTWE